MTLTAYPTHLEILNQVVEYSQTIGVLRILNIGKGSDFGGLQSQGHTQVTKRVNIDREDHA